MNTLRALDLDPQEKRDGIPHVSKCSWSVYAVAYARAIRALPIGKPASEPAGIALRSGQLCPEPSHVLTDRGRQPLCRFPDGRASIYFYWDDNPGRRSITQALSSEEAERKAKDLARTEQKKLLD
jgi:hypothetical protein